MGIKILSRHLISYAKDEKWLHDLMDGKKDRSQLYKKAMQFYINNANDPEFRGIPVQEQYKATPSAPIGIIEGKHIEATKEEVEDISLGEFQIDPNELMSIMNGGK